MTTDNVSRRAVCVCVCVRVCVRCACAHFHADRTRLRAYMYYIYVYDGSSLPTMTIDVFKPAHGRLFKIVEVSATKVYRDESDDGRTLLVHACVRACVCVMCFCRLFSFFSLYIYIYIRIKKRTARRRGDFSMWRSFPTKERKKKR